MTKYLIPENIETERLILRTFKEEDWKDLYHYYSDAECMKYTVGRALADWETELKEPMWASNRSTVTEIEGETVQLFF